MKVDVCVDVQRNETCRKYKAKPQIILVEINKSKKI